MLSPPCFSSTSLCDTTAEVMTDWNSSVLVTAKVDLTRTKPESDAQLFILKLACEHSTVGLGIHTYSFHGSKVSKAVTFC